MFHDVGLAKKSIQVFLYTLMEKSNKLFGQFNNSHSANHSTNIYQVASLILGHSGE